MDKIQFKVKFFGTKERKGQIKQQATVVMAESEAKVEDALRLQGWATIHGLKIRKAQQNYGSKRADKYTDIHRREL